jgi:hypothetical protein
VLCLSGGDIQFTALNTGSWCFHRYCYCTLQSVP